MAIGDEEKITQEAEVIKENEIITDLSGENNEIKLDVQVMAIRTDLIMLLNNTFAVDDKFSRTDLFKHRFGHFMTINTVSDDVKENLKGFFNSRISQISIHFLCLEMRPLKNTESLRYMTPTERRAWAIELNSILMNKPISNSSVEA